VGELSQAMRAAYQFVLNYHTLQLVSIFKS